MHCSWLLWGYQPLLQYLQCSAIYCNLLQCSFKKFNALFLIVVVLRGLEARPGGTEVPLSSNIHAITIMMMMVMNMMVMVKWRVMIKKILLLQSMSWFEPFWDLSSIYDEWYVDDDNDDEWSQKPLGFQNHHHHALTICPKVLNTVSCHHLDGWWSRNAEMKKYWNEEPHNFFCLVQMGNIFSFATREMSSTLFLSGKGGAGIILINHAVFI